jgi:thiamine-phosphate pyrophosphorylase
MRVDWLRGYYAILDLAADVVVAASADVVVAASADVVVAASADVVAISPAELERRADQLLAAGPCCLQLRAKSLSAAALREAARVVGARCRAAGVPFCVNDRLDVALLVGADVVHLGQDDLPLTEARRVAAGRLLIGTSTHGAAQVSAAIAGGADYLGFGPVFATGSKHRADPPVGLEALSAICATAPIPVVAIGGITLDNIAAVVATGAAAAAVIAAVTHAPDPTRAARQVARAFIAARPNSL